MTTATTPDTKPRGKRLKHGGRALSAAIKANRLDRRTWLARFIEDTEAALADDFGGFPSLSTLDLLKVQHAAALWAEMQALFAFRQQGLLEGKPDPETAKYAVSLSNALGRALDSLGTPRRRGDELPTLSAYLASKPARAAQPVIEIEATPSELGE